MGIIKRATGNMYEWVTHLWSPISGCPHQCSYCLVKSFKELKREITIDKEFPALGSGKTLFVGHLCDMFAEAVPKEMIERVMDHIIQYPHNTYVLQSKNPRGIFKALNGLAKYDMFALNDMKIVVGTTIETNRAEMLKKISNAPEPIERARGIAMVKEYTSIPDIKTFVTVEPVLDFDVDEMHNLIRLANPSFVNIGADSKENKLNEPTPEKIKYLIDLLTFPTEKHPVPIRIKIKSNLSRLMKG